MSQKAPPPVSHDFVARTDGDPMRLKLLLESVKHSCVHVLVTKENHESVTLITLVLLLVYGQS